jgi:NADH dehydrogenase [ubiquinone] 1 alpha subcomplex assembly factor 3
MQSLRSSISGLKRSTIHEIAASILTICWTRRSCRTPNISHSPPRPNQTRLLHFSRTEAVYSPSHPPKSRNRGPASTESTQTDFSKLDVLGGAPVPSTSVDACLRDGFKLNNGLTIAGGAGVLLVGGEAFSWRPWDAREKGGSNLLNSKGQWEVANEAWGILELVWPKPGMYAYF